MGWRRGGLVATHPLAIRPDLEVRAQERDFIARMVERLDLDSDERQSVKRWLQAPPPPDSIDPTHIPARHRKLFVEAGEGDSPRGW
jgi:hypothetical protein